MAKQVKMVKAVQNMLRQIGKDPTTHVLIDGKKVKPPGGKSR